MKRKTVKIIAIILVVAMVIGIPAAYIGSRGTAMPEETEVDDVSHGFDESEPKAEYGDVETTSKEDIEENESEELETEEDSEEDSEEELPEDEIPEESEQEIEEEVAEDPVKDAMDTDEIVELARQRSGAPLAELDSVTDDGKLLIHLYEDMGDHTATWDWYEIDPDTLQGTNIVGAKINIKTGKAIEESDEDESEEPEVLDTDKTSSEP